MSQSPAQRLLSWYRQHGRDLPWRHVDDPYAIWVSEVMLQQTQVSTVIPYFQLFMARFPTVSELAAASLDELLVIWQGLGYYRRARAMHRASQIVVAEHGGLIPSNPSILQNLPGIGDYTAGAILSIAFGQDVPAIDGNVIRVMARLHDYAGDPSRSAGKRFVRDAASTLLVLGQAGDSNQAMMELGATICTPRNPACERCPLHKDCLAHANDTIAARPVRRKRAPTPTKLLGAALVDRGERILLVRRRPEGLLGGLWELPTTELAEHVSGQELGEALSQRLGALILIGGELGRIQHAYTHFRIVVRVFAATVEGAPAADGDTWDDQRWVDASEVSEIGITGATKKILTKLPWPGSDKLL